MFLCPPIFFSLSQVCDEKRSGKSIAGEGVVRAGKGGIPGTQWRDNGCCSHSSHSAQRVSPPMSIGITGAKDLHEHEWNTSKCGIAQSRKGNCGQIWIRRARAHTPKVCVHRTVSSVPACCVVFPFFLLTIVAVAVSIVLLPRMTVLVADHGGLCFFSRVSCLSFCSLDPSQCVHCCAV